MKQYADIRNYLSKNLGIPLTEFTVFFTREMWIDKIVIEWKDGGHADCGRFPVFWEDRIVEARSRKCLTPRNPRATVRGNEKEKRSGKGV